MIYTMLSAILQTTQVSFNQDPETGGAYIEDEYVIKVGEYQKKVNELTMKCCSCDIYFLVALKFYFCICLWVSFYYIYPYIKMYLVTVVAATGNMVFCFKLSLMVNS